MRRRRRRMVNAGPCRKRWWRRTHSPGGAERVNQPIVLHVAAAPHHHRREAEDRGAGDEDVHRASFHERLTHHIGGGVAGRRLAGRGASSSRRTVAIPLDRRAGRSENRRSARSRSPGSRASGRPVNVSRRRRRRLVDGREVGTFEGVGHRFGELVQRDALAAGDVDDVAADRSWRIGRRAGWRGRRCRRR